MNKYQGYLDKQKGGGKRIPADKIRAWLERHFDVKPRKGGEELTICNPFSGDTDFKFNINPDKGTCHCWTGDEWAGPVNPNSGKRNCSFVNFVKIFRKCSYPEAVREIVGASDDLKSYLRPENRHSTAEPLRKIEVALPKGTERLADNPDDPQARLLIGWLKKRGYDLAAIDRFDLHYIGVNCYWPYYESDNLVYWQSRNRFNKIYKFPDLVVYNDKGDVVGETDGKKSEFLYGFDDCQCATYLTITESIFGQRTIGDQALASGGAILTAEQIKKIRILGPRKGIILSPDNDAAGLKSIISNHKLLQNLDYPIYYTVPPKYAYKKDGETKYTKDWNELLEELGMTRDEVRQVHDKHLRPLNPQGISEIRGRLRT